MANDAEKIKMYREKAKDKSLPQDVRNTYLDKAAELEMKATEKSAYAKGGAVKKKPANPKAKPSAKGGVAIIIAPAKKMAKGGAVKKNGC